MLTPRPGTDRRVIEARWHSIGGVARALAHERHPHFEWRAVIQSADVEADIDVASLGSTPDRVDKNAKGSRPIHRRAARTARLIRGPRRHPERRERQDGDSDDERARDGDGRATGRQQPSHRPAHLAEAAADETQKRPQAWLEPCDRSPYHAASATE